MSTVAQPPSSLNCQIRLIRAENKETKTKSCNLFVRIHISAGKHGSVQLNSPEPSTAGGNPVSWDESFSLECNGNEDAVTRLREGAVVFELRRGASPAAGWGRRKSRVLGRAELPWEQAFCTPGSEILAWLPLGGGCGLVVGVKVERRVKVVAPTEDRWRRRGGGEGEGCGCEENYHLFGLAALWRACSSLLI